MKITNLYSLFPWIVFSGWSMHKPHIIFPLSFFHASFDTFVHSICSYSMYPRIVLCLWNTWWYRKHYIYLSCLYNWMGSIRNWGINVFCYHYYWMEKFYQWIHNFWPFIDWLYCPNYYRSYFQSHTITSTSSKLGNIII